MKGHIKITDKVYFVPDGLLEPNFDDFTAMHPFPEYENAVKAYEASKKPIKVSNVKKFLGEWVLTEIEVSAKDLTTLRIQNKQKVEAEVTDTAIITKIL